MPVKCPICCDTINIEGSVSIAALNCGHVYHEQCINKWLSIGNKTCPSCRQGRASLVRLYFDKSDCIQVNDIDTLRDKIVTLEQQYAVLSSENVTMKTKNSENSQALNKLSTQLSECESQRRNSDERRECLRRRVDLLQEDNSRLGQFEARSKEISLREEQLESTQKILKIHPKDVDEMLQNYSVSRDSVRQLSLMISMLTTERLRLLKDKIAYKRRWQLAENRVESLCKENSNLCAPLGNCELPVCDRTVELFKSSEGVEGGEYSENVPQLKYAKLDNKRANRPWSGKVTNVAKKACNGFGGNFSWKLPEKNSSGGFRFNVKPRGGV